jgi:hypothetical protein
MYSIYPHNISRGHYLPCKIYCLVLAFIKAIIRNSCFLAFAMIEPTYKGTSMQVF